MRSTTKYALALATTRFLLFSTDIDTIISEDLFKTEAEDGRRNAMMGMIELKSAMDDRVRELFQANLECKEEVEQIKNVYRYSRQLSIARK